MVLETIAANLGSMATPIGNPQNLYLCSAAGLSMGQFAWAVLPYASLSLAILAAVLLCWRDEPLPPVPAEAGEDVPLSLPRLAPFLALFGLCLLVVFRVVDYRLALVCVVLVVAVVDRALFGQVDYFLLLTFLCFFLFVGNLKRVPALNELLQSLVGGHELLAGIAMSQIISNVPAAILLSGFSRDFAALLTGVDLGGLGTPIASLASLISLKLYAGEHPEGRGAFLKSFALWNAGFLAVLTAAALILSPLAPKA